MNKNQPHEVGVCAWCRHTYGGEHNAPIRRLSDKEYAHVKTHGMCRTCGEAAVEECSALQEESHG